MKTCGEDSVKMDRVKGHERTRAWTISYPARSVQNAEFDKKNHAPTAHELVQGTPLFLSTNARTRKILENAQPARALNRNRKFNLRKEKEYSERQAFHLEATRRGALRSLLVRKAAKSSETL